MFPIKFTIYGEPKALKRHRTYTKGKGGRPLPFPMQVDPSKGDKADFLAQALPYRPSSPINEAISLNVEAYFGHPKSHYGKRAGKPYLKPTAFCFHIVRPDADNVLKFVMDALAGIFWSNDTIIWSAKISKHYSDKPRIEITIS